MLALALIKEHEIIGEAAGKVSPDTKKSLPSIPWTDIVGMRNRLIHASFDITCDILWDTVNSPPGPLCLLGVPPGWPPAPVAPPAADLPVAPPLARRPVGVIGARDRGTPGEVLAVGCTV